MTHQIANTLARCLLAGGTWCIRTIVATHTFASFAAASNAFFVSRTSAVPAIASARKVAALSRFLDLLSTGLYVKTACCDLLGHLEEGRNGWNGCWPSIPRPASPVCKSGFNRTLETQLVSKPSWRVCAGPGCPSNARVLWHSLFCRDRGAACAVPLLANFVAEVCCRWTRTVIPSR